MDWLGKSMEKWRDLGENLGKPPCKVVPVDEVHHCMSRKWSYRVGISFPQTEGWTDDGQTAMVKPVYSTPKTSLAGGIIIIFKFTHILCQTHSTRFRSLLFVDTCCAIINYAWAHPSISGACGHCAVCEPHVLHTCADSEGAGVRLPLKFVRDGVLCGCLMGRRGGQEVVFILLL